jgi:FkbM family methyltransferase
VINDNFTPGGVVHISYEGTPYDVFVLDANDHIAQMLMKHGSFYEKEELELIRKHVPENAFVIEVGANIGNHTIYFEKVLRCRNNIVFEPNPPAVRALRLTMQLNGLQRVDTSYLGLALSDGNGNGEMSTPATNLGGASFSPNEDGSIRCVAADDLLGDQVVADFIKIDVEGTEMRVLAGMKQLISRCRPLMFIEVDASNEDAFHEWLQTWAYEIRESYKRYRPNKNYLVAPVNPVG